MTMSHQKSESLPYCRKAFGAFDWRNYFWRIIIVDNARVTESHLDVNLAKILAEMIGHLL